MSEQKPVEKENIFISTESKDRSNKYAKTRYSFNGEEYFYLDQTDEGNALLKNFQSLAKKDSANFNVRLCLYKLVDECKEPFLQFLLDKKDEKMTFPSFELSTDGTNRDFEEKCYQQFLQVIRKVDEPTMTGGGTIEIAEQCYRGFLEEPDNTLYVLFDCTYLHVEINAERFWGILDEIVNEKQIFKTPIDKDIYNMIQNHEYIAYIKDKKGERINMPCCLYLCKINDQGEYDNVHYEIDEHNMKHKSLVDGKIGHDTFGHFYYFTTDPIHKDENSLRLKRYSVFIDNALYVLNINKPIEEIDFVTDDEDDFDETHKSYKDYTCIYFFEDGIQLWCIKSLSRFVEL
jgi:hypothetical protein